MSSKLASPNRKNLLFALFAALAIALGPSCATPPPAKPPTLKERIQQDSAKSQQYAKKLEAQLQIKKDSDVSRYLSNLAQTLVDATPELRGNPAKVQILQDKGDVWRSYALPGNRVYLSLGVVRTVDFENELAAAIALELGNILNRHAIKRLEAPSGPPPFFGPGGVFDFTEEELAQSVDAGVGVLYRAGVDPRGMVTLLQRFQAHPASSPYPQKDLAGLVDQSRQSVAMFTPLRNPLVRSQAFLLIQRRIRRL